MSALLALIPIKDWLYGGAIALLIIFGLHYHHKVLAEGIAEQKAADDKASAALVQQTAKQTAELQAKATMAEQAYEKELQSIDNQPSAGSVRLCVNSHPGGSIVRQASGSKPGDASAGATASSVQSVSSRDSSSGGSTAGPDIGQMLSALAAAADRDSATLREFQARE